MWRNKKTHKTKIRTTTRKITTKRTKLPRNKTYSCCYITKKIQGKKVGGNFGEIFQNVDLKMDK